MERSSEARNGPYLPAPLKLVPFLPSPPATIARMSDEGHKPTRREQRKALQLRLTELTGKLRMIASARPIDTSRADPTVAEAMEVVRALRELRLRP